MNTEDLEIGDIILVRYGDNRWWKERVINIIDKDVFTGDSISYTRINNRDWRFIRKANLFEKIFY